MPDNVNPETIPFAVQAVQTLGPWEVSNFAWASVQVTSQYTGSSPAIAFQCSNDGLTNWSTVVLENSNATASPMQSSATTTGTFHGPLPGKWFRLNFTGAYSSGTAAGTICFFQNPRVLNSMGVVASNQSGAFNVGLSASAAGGYSFLNMPTASTNNAVKSGSGTLHTFTINTQVASATATLYDALTATGTKIATVTLPASLVGDGPITIPYDIIFATGLTIVTTGTNFDCTVSYK